MWTSRSALKINLWHGIPMKKIEHDIDSGPLQKIYNPRGIVQNIMARLKAPYVYDKSINVLATSEEVRGLFSKAFRIKKSQLANYFTAEEDIFELIPNQKTNQIFTPKKVVQMMINNLGEHDPSLFTRTDSTFIDLYMKSGMYISEIVKKLFAPYCNLNP